MSYTPAVNAPAQSTHMDLPQNVVEALARLRSDGWTPCDHNPGESYDGDRGQGVPVAEDQEEAGMRLQGERLEEEAGEGQSRCRRGGELRQGELRGSVFGGFSAEAESRCFHGEAGVSRDGFAEEEMVLDGPTCQRLLAATTEFNCGIIMGAMQDSFRPFLLWEVCCRADSTLSQACQKVGMQIERKTLSTGYDMNKNGCIDALVTEATSNPPDRAWFSLMCTAVTLIQNINQRNQRQIDDLRKKRQKCRRQLKGAIKTIWSILEASGGSSKFYFEWPKNAYHGWNMKEMQEFIYHFEKIYGKLFFVQIDGCMHGVVCPEGWPLKKSWIILTNDAEFRDRCQLYCDGTHQHRPGGIIGIGSKAVESTGFYPMSMVTAVARCWKSQWQRQNQLTNKEIHNTLHSMEENYGAKEAGGADQDRMTSLKFPGEDKAGRDRAWSMLHQLHRAAGHPSNRSLARLCRDRGMPPWLVQMALDLKCQACIDTKKGEQLTLPVNIAAKPKPWQVVGMDVFELAFPKQKVKARFLLMLCLTMRLMAVSVVWQGQVHEVGTDPGDRMIQAFADSWLLHRPRPEWCLVDAQSSLCKGTFPSFLRSIGIGLCVAAGQAHWQHGATESGVKAIKETMKRLRNEQPTLSPKVCSLLAAAAHNQTDKVKGFSPIQWAYGSDPSQWGQPDDPLMVNQKFENNPVDFWQLQRHRERAEEVHRQELAKQKISRLYNAAGKPASAYAVGDWVCVWRKATLKSRKQEMNPEARFIGPGRVALIEPSGMKEGHGAVIWVLMGTALWRAAPEQLRAATETEVLTETLRLGEKAVMPMADPLKRLHSTVDVTKEPRMNPAEDLLPDQPPEDGMGEEEEDIAQDPESWQQDIARGRAEAPTRRRSRSRSTARRKEVKQDVRRWNQLTSINEARRRDGLGRLTSLPPEHLDHLPGDVGEFDSEERTLTRHHHQERWTLFVPTGQADCPIHLKDILSSRTTFWWDDSQHQEFSDDWRKAEEPEQPFSRPWTGRTVFKVKAGCKKRKVEHYDIADDEPIDADDFLDENAVFEETFATTNDIAVDKTYVASNDLVPEETFVTESKEVIEETFDLDETRAKIDLEKKDEECLLAFLRSEAAVDAEEACFLEFEVDNMKAFVADSLSYVQEKLHSAGKEVNFRKLSSDDQKLMMEAMAKEVSEVLRSMSLRAIRDYVPENVLKERCLPMRWILTWKPLTSPEEPPTDGSPTTVRPDGLSKAKARVVLIGYKHPDLARRDERTGKRQLQTSSPTLSRLGRQMFLQATALDMHTLESADAKSAFLQADAGIGTDALYTFGVPELQHAFGLQSQEALQVIGAFYGLTSAPRIFWKDADQKINKIGGQTHALDKCMWLFKDPNGRIVGRVASHVDDFLIAGDHRSEYWKEVRQKLKGMYQWSPWQAGTFVFAGVELKQTKDYSIYLTQETFCNALRPVLIQGEHGRPAVDPLTASELTQCRGLTMKAQWRAIQSAPQYAASIGMLASALSKGTVKEMKEANSLMKELRKTAKEDLVFHSFNFHRQVPLKWNELIAVHFGDAGLNNRPCGGSTGGYVTGFAEPSILEGKQAKLTIIDWRSWKLDRPSKGSNSAEGQAIYEAEDRGWKCRLFWAILNGERLVRGCATDLTSMMESLLVMDSRGCFDSITTSESVMLGMANARTGVEMLHVQHGTDDRSRCYPTWVPGDINLADALTKNTYEAYKVMALYHTNKSWIVRFNSEFVSARKQQKLRRQKALEESKTLGPVLALWPEEDLNILERSLFGISEQFPTRF